MVRRVIRLSEALDRLDRLQIAFRSPGFGFLKP